MVLGTFRGEEGGAVEDCPRAFPHRRCRGLVGRLTPWSEGTDVTPRRASWRGSVWAVGGTVRREGVRTRNVARGVLRWEVAGAAAGEGEGLGKNREHRQLGRGAQRPQRRRGWGEQPSQ